MLLIVKHRPAYLIAFASVMLLAVPAHAVVLNCSGPHMGEIFIDTATGSVTKSAEETLKVEIATEDSHYRFQFKGKKNQFKALINRASGQIIMDDACTPECWGGPIFGVCIPVKAKL